MAANALPDAVALPVRAMTLIVPLASLVVEPPFELTAYSEPEAGPEGGDDRADQVGEDVLGVIELDVGEVAGVAGDIRDQEAGRLRGEHQSSTGVAASRTAATIDVDHAPSGEGSRGRVRLGWQNRTARPPGSAREARTQFETGFGDALVTYELEGLLMKAAGAPVEMIVPQATSRRTAPAA